MQNIFIFIQSQLDKHLQEHRQEQTGVKSYPCKQCNVEFNKPTYLREHMKQHYKIKYVIPLHARSELLQFNTNFSNISMILFY